MLQKIEFICVADDWEEFTSTIFYDKNKKYALIPEPLDKYFFVYLILPD